MNRICIPDWEYQERIKKAAKLVREKGLDVMVVCSTESDYANARYFSFYLDFLFTVQLYTTFSRLYLQNREIFLHYRKLFY